jgi:dihydrodipicolinate synthase/N-acetylneuraminate lyase
MVTSPVVLAGRSYFRDEEEMASSEPIFRGVGVALVTLFDESGAADIAATVDHAAAVVDRGVRAVLLAGTTSEFWALTESDRTDLIRGARAALPPDVPVLAGTGADHLAAAARMTAAAVAAGAHAVLALPPRGAADLAGYYGTIADAAAGRPVLGYHMPSVSPPGLPLDKLGRLPIQGIKDSSLDPRRLLAELDIFASNVYTGVDSLLSYAGPLGCTGALGAMANIEPELCAAAFAGDVAAQRALARLERVALDRFPLGLKQLLSERAGTSTALGRGTAALHQYDG